MGRNDFVLITEADSALVALAPPALARIPLGECRPVVAPGDALLAGAAVGEPRTPLAPWAHTPIAGEVLEVGGGFVTVRKDPARNGQVEPVNIAGLSGAPLLEALARCGVDATNLRPAKHLIINAAPPEPAIAVTSRLLRDCRDTLARGLALTRTIVAPTKVTVAGPDVDAQAFGNCAVARLKPLHPQGLDPLVIKAVTGQEHSDGVVLLNLFQLMALGRVSETGRPCTEVYLTVQDRNFQASIGTPLHEVLAAAGLQPADGDRAVLGGPLRGAALCLLDQGLARGDYGLFLIPADSHPPVHDAACLNCGECARHCPARIYPGELSMCAEAGLMERARLGHVEICFECGICGYVCPARRPLLQYIQLAKSELRLLDAANAKAGESVSAAPSKDAEGAR